MVVQLAGILAPIIGKIAEKWLGSKEKAEEFQREVMMALIEKSAEIERLRAEIIKAEAQGKSWLQRNWRPILMLSFIAILVNNYILFPYLSIFTDKVRMLEFPDEFWTLLQIGVGGYIGSRFVEKLARRD